MRILVAFILLITLNACDFEGLTIGGIKNAKILNFSKESVEVEISVPITNPGSIGFTISKVEVDLSLNGVELGHVNEKKSTRIKPKSNGVYPIVFKIKLKDTFQGLPKLIAAYTMGRKMDIKAKGKIKVRKFIFSKTFEFDESAPINLLNKK